MGFYFLHNNLPEQLLNADIHLCCKLQTYGLGMCVSCIQLDQNTSLHTSTPGKLLGSFYYIVTKYNYTLLFIYSVQETFYIT